MIIKKIKDTLGMFIREQATTVNWPQIEEEKIECAIDENIVDCESVAFKQDALNYYTGIPAPAYLPDDEWFGPTPNLTEKQKDYMAVEMEWKIEEEKKREKSGIEPDDIHQKMYEIATKNQSTTLHLDPIGGSENFQGGSENVHQ